MGLLNGHPQSAHPRVQFAEAGCCRTIGLQWRSENLIQHLEFHEKKLNNEGAYKCFLTKIKNPNFNSASSGSGRPRLASGATWGWTRGSWVVFVCGEKYSNVELLRVTANA